MCHQSLLQLGSFRNEDETEVQNVPCEGSEVVRTVRRELNTLLRIAALAAFSPSLIDVRTRDVLDDTKRKKLNAKRKTTERSVFFPARTRDVRRPPETTGTRMV